MASQEFLGTLATADLAQLNAVEVTKAAVAGVQSLLQTTPPALISAYGLESLNSLFGEMLEQLSTFINERNPAYLVHALSKVEQQIMPGLWAFAPTSLMSNPAAVGEAFQRVLDQSNAASIQSAGMVATLQNEVSGLKSQLADANGRLTTLNEDIATQKANNAAAVAEIQRQYAESETVRVNEFNKKLALEKSEYSKQLDLLASERSAAIDKLNADVKKSADLVKITANQSTSGHYSRRAGEETWQANFWRLITIALFSISIFVAANNVYHLYDEQITGTNMWTVLVRFLFALVIAAPAFYTAKESARHRTTADRASQRELELAAIGPFIESMPTDMKNAILKEQTERMFGKDVDEHKIESPLDLKTAVEALTKFTEVIKK